MTATQPTQPDSAWVAFRSPTFRWVYIAQTISTIGTFMQLAAINWHVYAITGDMLALGLVGLVRVVPIIVLSLLGGVVADAIDRRKLMLWTQTAMLILSTVLAVTTMSGHATIAVIYILTAAISGMGAFDRPAWAALLPKLVPERNIASAVRMNVLLMQITSVVGPVLAGLLLGATNPGFAYAVNAVSFIPVVAVLWLIHVPPVLSQEKSGISFDSLFEGLRFIRQTPLLWSTMMLDFFATFFASALALLPVYASDILKVGAEGYGVLYAAPSIGAVFGAFVMAQYAGRIKRQGELMLGAVACFGLATIVFGISTSFWLSLIALAVTGLSDSVSMMIRNTLRQLLTPDRLRGRMLSVNMIFFMGGPQLGEFEAGLVARAFGAPFSVVSGGVGAVLVVLAMAFGVPTLRRYRELPLPVDAQPAAGNEEAHDEQRVAVGAD